MVSMSSAILLLLLSSALLVADARHPRASELDDITVRIFLTINFETRTSNSSCLFQCIDWESCVAIVPEQRGEG
jgi:hypothetical protein